MLGTFLPTDPDKIYDRYHQLSYRDALARDEKRYKAADTDGNGQLNREEFPAFLHPGRWLRRGEQGRRGNKGKRREKGGQREGGDQGGGMSSGLRLVGFFHGYLGDLSPRIPFQESFDNSAAWWLCDKMVSVVSLCTMLSQYSQDMVV